MTGPTSPATRVRRRPERGRYDRETVYQILDEALICHVGFVADGRPFVIPTIHARLGDAVYFHGSPGSRMLAALAGGADCCLTATLVDGLVLARAAFHHSMNYRSAVVLGVAEQVTDADEKARAFEAVVEHVAPGRWQECRWPAPKEAQATIVLKLPITEYSAKVRTGPPIDDDADVAEPIWAGLLPLQLVPGSPEPSPDLPSGIPVPASVTAYRRK